MNRQSLNIKKAKSIANNEDIKFVFDHYYVDYNGNAIFYSKFDLYVYWSKVIVKFLSYFMLAPVVLVVIAVLCVTYIPFTLSVMFLDKFNKWEWFYNFFSDIRFSYKNRDRIKIGKRKE